MSFVVKTDRFADLRAKLGVMASAESRRLHLRKEVEQFGTRFLSELRQEAPVGDRWIEPDYTFKKGQRRASIREWRPVNRPSIRQFGATLDSSWVNPVISSSEDRADVMIGTSTPQARYILQGSPPHIIPRYIFRKPFVSFWWHKKSEAVLARRVNHPGIVPNKFVERTFFYRGRKMGSDSLARAMKNLRQPLVNFFRSG